MFSTCREESNTPFRDYNKFFSSDPVPMVGTFLDDLKNRGFKQWPELLENIRRAMIMYFLVTRTCDIGFKYWDVAIQFGMRLVEEEAHLDYSDKIGLEWGLGMVMEGGCVLTDNYQPVDCIFYLYKKNKNTNSKPIYPLLEKRDGNDNLCK